MTAKQAWSLVATFACAVLVAAITIPLEPDYHRTASTLQMAGGIAMLIGIGFATIIFLDIGGKLDDDESGPNFRPAFTWTGAMRKLSHVGTGFSGIGCGVLLHGVMVTPHNYSGLGYLCLGFGQFLGIWLALAWPPRRGY